MKTHDEPRTSGPPTILVQCNDKRGRAVRVATAHSIEDWIAARSIVQGLLDYIARETEFDLAEMQASAADELDAMASFYAWPNGLFFVARLEGAPVGSSGVKLLEPGVAELKRVFVADEARGAGMAPVMLRAAMRGARILGAQSLVLETYPPAMAKAVELYRANGFRERAPYSPLADAVPGLLTLELDLNTRGDAAAA